MPTANPKPHVFMSASEIAELSNTADRIGASIIFDRILADLEAMRIRAENAEALLVNAAPLDEAPEMKAKDAELDRLRKELEDAPHDAICKSKIPPCRSVCEGCDSSCRYSSWQACECWKSRALNQQPTEPAETKS